MPPNVYTVATGCTSVQCSSTLVQAKTTVKTGKDAHYDLRNMPTRTQKNIAIPFVERKIR